MPIVADGACNVIATIVVRTLCIPIDATLSHGRRGKPILGASEVLCEGPKPTQGQHLKVAHNGEHHVERQVLLALFNVPQIKLLATYAERNSSLRLALPYSQLRYRQAKDLSWCTGLSRDVRSDPFSHTAIVTDSRRLI